MLTAAPNVTVSVTAEASVINAADKIVLPGQGAVGTWFDQLDERNLRDSIERARTERPLLGICVGMQALFDYCSEDGGRNGLGWFSGRVEHFSQFHTQALPSEADVPPLKIPQMGWNRVTQTQSHPLWHGIGQDAYFYFVHSYCANTPNNAAIFGTANYGHEFVAAIASQNVFATQFHPEKSHDDGLRLLKNFAQWNGSL